MKIRFLIAAISLAGAGSAQALTATQLQSAIDAARAKSAAKIWTPGEERAFIKSAIDIYYETHPRTWSQWLFSDPPAGVTTYGLAVFDGPSPVKVSYGSFGPDRDEFLGSGPMNAYGLASVRFYSYRDDPNDTVFLSESFDVANNFSTTLTLGGFEPVIHAISYDALGNRITILDENGINGADAYGLVFGVPEPSSWLTMIVGFGTLGALARYRRTFAARAC